MEKASLRLVSMVLMFTIVAALVSLASGDEETQANGCKRDVDCVPKYKKGLPLCNNGKCECVGALHKVVSFSSDDGETQAKGCKRDVDCAWKCEKGLPLCNKGKCDCVG